MLLGFPLPYLAAEFVISCQIITYDRKKYLFFSTLQTFFHTFVFAYYSKHVKCFAYGNLRIQFFLPDSIIDGIIL